MGDQAIESEIQAKGLTAPRITPDDIEGRIESAYYFTAAQGAAKAALDGGSYMAGPPEHGAVLGTLTICVLILNNGFTVTGESACASPENYDEGIGRKIARANAVQKIWPLEGYLLRTKLAEGGITDKVSKSSSLVQEQASKRIAHNTVDDSSSSASMDFGQAVAAMKAGCKVARKGWNGAGMFAYLVPANEYPAQTGAAKSHFGEGALVPYRAYMALKTAQDDVATWTPSGSDALAEDWMIVE